MIDVLALAVRRRVRLWWPAMAVAAFVAAIMAVGSLAVPLRLAYPVLAVAIGVRLERRHPARYVSFVVWLWFLSPFVRRITDLYGGWQDPSVVLLTPYLVTAIAVPSLFHGILGRPGSLRPFVPGFGMFALAASAVALGVPMGMMRGPNTAMLETLNWLLPPCFGWYIATRVEEGHRIEAALATTFAAAATVAGAYGIYQFGRPPLWDINWMQRSGMTTIGSPEPFAVRVFSTMHSPGVLSAFLVIALTLWLARPRWSVLPGAGMAGVVLLLSQVRSAWLATVIAGALVFASLTHTQRMRMAVLGLVGVLIVGPLLFTGPMRELVSSRIATMERLEDDESAVARLMGHAVAFRFVAENPLGAGIGQSDKLLEHYISMRDSVIAGALVQFGLVGTTLYFAALAAMTWLLASYYRRAASIQGAALAAAGISLVATSWLSVVTAGPIGVCLWTMAGLAVSDRARRSREAEQVARVAPWRTWVVQHRSAPA